MANDGSLPMTTTVEDPLPGDAALLNSLDREGLEVPIERVDVQGTDGATPDAASSADVAGDEEPSQPIQRRQQLAGAVEYAPVSQEEELAARIAISEEVFGADGPFECDSICDCEPGEGCDTGAGICIPGLFGGRCCEWDECPPGSPCVTAEGHSDVCAD